MKTHYINIALIAAAMLTGCNTVGPEEAHMTLDDISLTIKGEKQFKYSKDNFQLAAGNPLQTLAQKGHTEEEKGKAAQKCDRIRNSHISHVPFSMQDQLSDMIIRYLSL